MRSLPFSATDTLGLPFLVTIQTGITVIRFTTYNTSLTVGSNTFAPWPGSDVTNVQFPSDGSPATADVVVMGRTGKSIAPGDGTRGALDGWPITIELVDPGNLAAGSFDLIPKATIGSVQETTRGLITMSVNGPLNRARGPLTEHYSLTCRADLGDSRCKVDLTSYTVSTTGQATGYFTIKLDSMSDTRASDDTWFVLGAITIKSGPLLGYPKIPIRAWSFSTLEVTTFLPVALTDIPAGTSMDIHAGCDLTPDQCLNRFNNIVNIRAEYFVPPANSITGVF